MTKEEMKKEFEAKVKTQIALGTQEAIAVCIMCMVYELKSEEWSKFCEEYWDDYMDE